MNEAFQSLPNSSSVMRMVSNFVSGSAVGDDNDAMMQIRRTGSADSGDSNDSTSPTPSSPPPLDGLSLDNIAQVESQPMPVMITQASPVKVEPLSTGSSPARTTSTRSSPARSNIIRSASASKGELTTPSRRSKRHRTPSMKKKEWEEAQRLLSSNRKQSKLRTSETAPATLNPLDSSFSVERAILTSTTASVKEKKSRLLSSSNRRKLASSAIKTPSSIDTSFTVESAILSNDTSDPSKQRVSATTARDPISAKEPSPLPSEPPSLTTMNLTPTKAPSPSGELLNADILNTPTQSALLGGNDDDMTWLSAATPTTYFGESPLNACTPPPKRQTRVRTPFAKASIDLDDDDDDNDDSDTELESEACVPKAPVRKQGLPPTDKSPSNIIKAAEESPAIMDTVVVETTKPTVKPSTTPASASYMAPTASSTLKQSTTPCSASTASSVREPFGRIGITSTPMARKRKTPTSTQAAAETPLRRSTRRASLLSSSSKRFADETPNRATFHAKAGSDASKIWRSTLSVSKTLEQSKSRNIKKLTVETPTTMHRSTIELAPDETSQATRKRRSTRRSTMGFTSTSSRLQESPSLSSIDSIGSKRRGTRRRTSLGGTAAKESPSVSSIDSSRSQRRSSRRASLAVTGRMDSPLSLSDISEVSSDNDEKPTKKPRSSRRASLSVTTTSRRDEKPSTEESPAPRLQLSGKFTDPDENKPAAKKPRSSRRSTLSTAELKPTLLGSSKNEALLSLASNKKNSMPPLPPSSSTSAKGSIRTSTFKLPPLPTASLSSKRNGRRASFAPTVKKTTGESIMESAVSTGHSHITLEATPSSAVQPPKRNVRRATPFKRSFELESPASKAGSTLEDTPSKASLRRSPRKPKQAPSPLVTSNHSTNEEIQKPQPVRATTKEESAPSALEANTNSDSIAGQPTKSGSLPLPQIHQLVATSTSAAASTTVVDTPSVQRRNARKKNMNIIASPALSRSVNGKLSTRTTPLVSRSNRLQSSSSKKHLFASCEKPLAKTTIQTGKQFRIKVQAEMITKYAARLFGDADISNEACISARIFAAYALQYMKSPLDLEDGTVPSLLRPLMPLLKSLVHVEMTSLEEQDQTLTQKAGRKVHFSGFDCSSLKPPVETKAGSDLHQRDSIDAMIIASHHIGTLTDPCQGDDAENRHISSSAQCALKSILYFLHGLDTETKAECAKSISTWYPLQRVSIAVELYRKDFETILRRVSPSSDALAVESKTHLEWRLAEFIGQSIRFHLRRLFNPPPLPLTRPSSDSDGSRSEQNVRPLLQSCVYEFVELKAPSTSRDSAIADCSISSLISLALSRIFDFFGAEKFRSAINCEGPICLPNSFCTSPGSRRGLGAPSKDSTKMPSEDLKQLIGDIDHVYNFLGAYKACKFLIELMHAPGVESEVERLGGWSTVEHYAKVLLEQNLSAVCVEDAHFSVIGYSETMKHFYAKIEDWLSHMKPKVALAEVSILQVAKRYKTRIISPKQKRALFRKFPHVKTIAEAIEEGQSRSSPFPTVAPVSFSP